jgi:hypothetical protein
MIQEVWHGDVHFFDVPKKQYKGRIATCRIEILESMPLREGDNVLYLDVDIIVKKSPFEIFRKPGDIFITTRPQKWKHMVNGGVWGFQYNEAGRRFIKFHIEQIHNKDWKPYRKYLEKFGHEKEINWRIGQDFLNVIRKNKLPFPCQVTDAGWQWNFSQHSGSERKFDSKRQAKQDKIFAKAKKEYAKAWLNPKIGILHFKARMKSEMGKYEI